MGVYMWGRYEGRGRCQVECVCGECVWSFYAKVVSWQRTTKTGA